MDNQIPALPWGGLSPAEVQRFIAQNGSPSAFPNSGENPNASPPLAQVDMDGVGPGPSSTIVQKPAATPADSEDDNDEESDNSPSSMANIMALLKPKPQAPVNLNLTDNSDYKNKLADAQQAQKSALLSANLGKAMQLIGSGAAGLASNGVIKPPTPQNQIFDDMAKSGNLPLEQLQAQKAAEADDPNSPISQAFKQFAKDKLGVNINGDFTANMGKQIIPMIFKDFEANQLQNSRNQAVGVKLLGVQQNKEAAADIKNTTNQQKAYQGLLSDDQKFRGNNAVQKANEGLKNSEAAMAIINSAGTNYNNLNSTQYNTLTSEIAKIATGGASTEAASKDMRANTLMSEAAKFWQTVSGKPTGAQLGEFIKQNKDYLDNLNTINHRYVNEFKANNYLGRRDELSDDKREEYEQNNPDVVNIANSKKKNNTGPSNQTTSSQTIKMKDPQGNIRSIPSDQKDAALAAGGTLVE